MEQSITWEKKKDTAFHTNEDQAWANQQVSQMPPRFLETQSWKFYEAGDALISGVTFTLSMTSTSRLMPRLHRTDYIT